MTWRTTNGKATVLEGSAMSNEEYLALVESFFAKQETNIGVRNSERLAAAQSIIDEAEANRDNLSDQEVIRAYFRAGIVYGSGRPFTVPRKEKS